jgi:hypothetical protein
MQRKAVPSITAAIPLPSVLAGEIPLPGGSAKRHSRR